MGDQPERSQRRLPAWLMGLLIAAVVFIAILVFSRLLGFGDDPVVEGLGVMGGVHSAPAA